MWRFTRGWAATGRCSPVMSAPTIPRTCARRRASCRTWRATPVWEGSYGCSRCSHGPADRPARDVGAAGRPARRALRPARLRGPSGAAGRWRYGGADGAIFHSIYYGRPRGMPAFGGLLPPDAIWKLVTYLQGLAPAVDPATVSW